MQILTGSCRDEAPRRVTVEALSCPKGPRTQIIGFFKGVIGGYRKGYVRRVQELKWWPFRLQIL